MKLYKTICATFAVAIFTGSSFAQTEKDTVYVFLENMPDAGIYLPAPPDMLSPQYAHFRKDNRYAGGRKSRDHHSNQ